MKQQLKIKSDSNTKLAMQVFNIPDINIGAMRGQIVTLVAPGKISHLVRDRYGRMWFVPLECFEPQDKGN